MISRLTGEQKYEPNREHPVLNSEAGQASVLLILMLGTFLLAALAFAVDLSGMWFHRQSAQSAADAACLAGAADMLAEVSGTTPPSPGFTIGTAGDCSSSSSASICKYANFNGYNGTGISSTAASNSVAWSFPGSVSSATAPTGITNPFLQVLVTENVQTFFMGLLGTNYQKVTAASTCGLVSIKSTPPLLILNPTASGTLATSSNFPIKIVNGPLRSIQVNSSSATAISSGSGTVDTSGAGPQGTGGDIGVVGGPSTPPTAKWLLGTTGNWVNPTLPIPDPYANVPAPTKPAAPPNPLGVPISVNTDGCPNPSGCTEYSPGYYASGIPVAGSATAIFKPGIYWMDGSLTAAANSILRNAITATPTDGVMFYFNQGNIQITGNSGVGGPSLASSLLNCGSSSSSPVGIPATIAGNILWAQCSAGGTYVGPGSTDTASSTGIRGLLIFNAHTNSTTPTTAGNGQLLFSGTLYFHSTTNAATWNLSGNAGSNTYLVGNIVADGLNSSGNASLVLSLNSAASVGLLKVAMLQ